MRYFVYIQPEGDEPSLGVFSKEELVKKLEEKWWGEIPILSHIPSSIEIGMCIIAGTITMPEPIKVVETWRLP